MNFVAADRSALASQTPKGFRKLARGCGGMRGATPGSRARKFSPALKGLRRLYRYKYRPAERRIESPIAEWATTSRKAFPLPKAEGWAQGETSFDVRRSMFDVRCSLVHLLAARTAGGNACATGNLTERGCVEDQPQQCEKSGRTISFERWSSFSLSHRMGEGRGEGWT